MNNLVKPLRRFLVITLVLSLLGNLALNAFATAPVGSANLSDAQIDIEEATKEEIAELSKRLDQQGFGGKSCTVKVLRNADGQGSYLLAFSENGYLIVERESYRFCECGDGNPYAEAENQSCYYGGPFCYFSSTTQASGAAGYYDLMRGEIAEHVTTVQRQEVSSDCETQAASSEAEPQASGDLSAVYLPDYGKYLTNRAFGYNDDGTCSAVATAIALSYISLKENMRLVADHHVPETLNKSPLFDDTQDTHEERKPQIQKVYPQAYNLHRYIVEQADLGWANFYYMISNGVEEYMNLLQKQHPCSAAYKLDCDSWYLPASNSIRNEIIAGRPVLMTTFATLYQDPEFPDVTYQWHTMCVYGHRRLNGENELLIHTGWYSSGFFDNWKNHKVKWLAEGYARFGYYFSYQNPLKQFTDLKKSFYQDYTFDGILYCVDKGLMNGTSASAFSPQSDLTRAMMATVLYRAAGSPSVSGYANPFTDVASGRYYSDAVRWAYKVGITNGTTATTFSPDAPLTRSQLAVMLFRFANYKKLSTSGRLATSEIKDWNLVQNHAKDAIQWAAYKKILVGNTIKMYHPSMNATRAEIAHAIYTLLKNS